MVIQKVEPLTERKKNFQKIGNLSKVIELLSIKSLSTNILLYIKKKNLLKLKCENFQENLTWFLRLLHHIIESPWLKVKSCDTQVQTVALTT